MTPLPGTLANIVPRAGDPGAIMRILHDLQRQINENACAIPLAMTSRNFDGTAHPLEPGTQGWALDSFGDAAFAGDTTIGGNLSVTGTETVGGTLHVTGNTVIDGTLSLPAGIINNDALASPATFAVINTNTAGYTITATTTTRLTHTVTVPSGYSRALVRSSTYVDGQAAAANKFLTAWTTINGTQSVGSFVESAGAVIVSVTDTFAESLTGLSGSFTVLGQVNCGFAGDFGSGTGDMHLTTDVVFLR